MADALCGPSNALSKLQKHAQADRSLQQDRLGARQPQQQQQQNENFRTFSSPSNGHVDAEFEAFQNGHTPSLQQQQQQQFPSAAPLLPHLHHAATAPAGLPAWAADFQQLNIHEARRSPIPAVRFRHEAPLQRPSGSSWHAEFMRHDGAQAGKTSTPPPMGAAATFGPGFSPPPMYMRDGTVDYASHMAQTRRIHEQSMANRQKLANQQSLANQQVDMFDDAAFAAAFDSAAAFVSGEGVATKGKEKEKEKERGKEREAETQQEQFSLDHACVEPPEPFFADVDEEQLSSVPFQVPTDASATATGTGQVNQEALRDYMRMSDAIEGERELLRGGGGGAVDMLPPDARDMGDTQMTDEEEGGQQEEEKAQDRMDPGLEADELSRTAGILLDNLKHEQNEKFANSSFMALMRQLRDREVKVEGDSFVETAQALHPGGPTYPHDAFQQHLPPRVAE